MAAVTQAGLYAALSAFRAAVTVGKSGKNPMFKSEYTTLGDVLAALTTLHEYDLAYSQTLNDGKVVTTVFHLGTGESIVSDIEISPEKNTPQSLISCVTYYRRVSLMTMLGLNADDDDGNMASKGSSAAPSRPRSTPAGAVAPLAAPANKSDNLALQLDRCKTVPEVNALYTKLFVDTKTKISDSELTMFKQRKGELNE